VIKSSLETLEPEERTGLIRGLHVLVTALDTTSIEQPQPARQRR